MAEFILEMQNIIKEFPGVKALDDVNLQVEKGEIHALVGENGAGKSTLMNVLSGIYPYGTYQGNISYNGEECKFKTIKDSEHKGIVIIHQELALVPYLSIAENIFLGNEQGSTFNIDWTTTHDKAKKYLQMVGLKEKTTTLIKDIGVGKQQLVEIAKALSKDVKLLILDEPTASLNENDSQKLLELLLKLREEKGITSIIISHKLNEISFVSDKITIIRDGSTIETLVKGVDDFSEPRIIKGMVGRELEDRFPKREKQIGDISLEVKSWTVYHPVEPDRIVCSNISLNVHKGEIVGISGLMGAGRTEFAMSIFGKSYGGKTKGQLFMSGKEIHVKNVKEAINNKIAYVTEDRKGNGLILENSIKINTTLTKMDKISHRGVIDTDKELQVAKEFKEKLNTKCPSVETNVGNLSGGNQQKVLLSKWIFADPEVLIMDEPTRGIDVGAKYEIYRIMNQLVSEGKSIIMISSELSEILGMCDRVYIMNEGKLVGEMDIADASQEAIMSKILQSSKDEKESAS